MVIYTYYHNSTYTITRYADAYIGEDVRQNAIMLHITWGLGYRHFYYHNSTYKTTIYADAYMGEDVRQNTIMIHITWELVYRYIYYHNSTYTEVPTIIDPVAPGYFLVALVALGSMIVGISVKQLGMWMLTSGKM